MRIVALMALFLAGPAFAQADGQIVDKASCLSKLSRAISIAEAMGEDHIQRYHRMLLSEVEDREKAEAIIAAELEIARQRQIIAETMFDLCATYD